MSSFDIIVLVREVRFNCRRIKRVYHCITGSLLLLLLRGGCCARSQAISYTWRKWFWMSIIDQSAMWCVIVMMLKNMSGRWISIGMSTRFMISWCYQLHVLRGSWSNTWDITSNVITSIYRFIYCIRSVELVFFYIIMYFILIYRMGHMWWLVLSWNFCTLVSRRMSIWIIISAVLFLIFWVSAIICNIIYSIPRNNRYRMFLIDVIFL